MNPEVIANLILAFCFGFTIAIFITPIFVYLKKVMYHPTQKKKLLEEAIKKDHVVKAKLIKEQDLREYDTQFGYRYTGQIMATYEYSYNGKTYRRKFISFNKFGDEVDLYFISNPRKAEFGGNLWVTAKNHWVKSFFIMVLLCSIISWFILVFK